MSALRVRVLGGLQVEGVEQSALGSRKQRRLLARLALAQGAAVSADELADDLWGDAPPASPRDQLAVLVSRLRGALPGGELVRVDAGYVLQVDWSDLVALEERGREAARRAQEQQWAAAAEVARSALALVRGPVLPELGELDWVVVAQAAAAVTAQQARLVLAEAALAGGDPRGAADVARDALVASPYDEVALRLHLDACRAAHSPALGLATYAETRARLVDELGVEPSAESRAAYQRLLEATGEGPPPPAEVAAPAGRQREVARLMQAVSAAAVGPATLVVVTGETGIGKSRVLQAVEGATSHLVVRARCDELGRVLPLQPVLDGLAAVLRARTESELGELLAGEAALLSPLLGLVAHEGGPGLPDGGTGQLLLQAAVVRLLERLAGGGVVVLVVEDGHLADPATVALITGLPRRATRVAALVAARSGSGPSWPVEHVIELGPLDLEAVVEVVGPERARELHARSGGHPLLLTELAAHGDEALPDSLRTAFGAAADQAGAAGATLRAASVVGPELDLDVLAQVLQRPAVELLDDLEEGVRRRLLVERAGGFAFRHALVREALAADVGPTRTALLHRETARALAERPRTDPLVLADHARAGGLTALAAQALAAAAAIAGARHAHEEALRLADEALALEPSLTPAALQRARALLTLGRYADASGAAALAVQLGSGSDALQVGGLAAHYQRDWDLGTALADQAAEEASSPAGRAVALAIGGHVRHAAGDVAGAERRFAEAGHVSAAPSGWLALLRQHQGRNAETLELTGGTAAEGTGLDLLALPLVQMSRGLALAALARPAEALQCFDDMDRLVERLDIARYAGRADNCRAHVLRNLGMAAQADDLNQSAREGGARVSVDEPVAHALLDLAEGRLRVGDLSAASALLDAAGGYAGDERRHGFQWRQRLRAGWLRGRLALAAGDSDAAGQHAVELLRRAELQEAARYQAFGRVLQLRVQLSQGFAPSSAEALGTLDGLTGVAGMEQLWVTLDLAAESPAEVRDALLERASRIAESILAASPVGLREGLRKVVSARLS